MGVKRVRPVRRKPAKGGKPRVVSLTPIEGPDGVYQSRVLSVQETLERSNEDGLILGGGFCRDKNYIKGSIKRTNGKGFLRECRIKIQHIYNNEFGPDLNEYMGVAKFTKPCYNPHNNREISLGTPSYYRGDFLSDEERLSIPFIDPSEGIIPIRTGSELLAGWNENHVRVFNGQSVRIGELKCTTPECAILCMSMIAVREHEGRNFALLDRFAEETWTHWVGCSLKSVAEFSARITSDFIFHTIENRETVFEWTKDWPIHYVEVFHGPVVYVEDRDRYLKQSGLDADGIMNGTAPSPVIANFVKPAKDGFRRYSVEQEYRFCIYGPCLLKPGRFTVKLGDQTRAMMDCKGTYQWHE